MAPGRHIDILRSSAKRTRDDLILLHCGQSHRSLYEGSTYEENDEEFSKLLSCGATTTRPLEVFDDGKT